VIHLGSIGGTSIDLDFSFLILVVFFVFMNMDAQQNVALALMWAPIVFISVLIHEFAHAGTIGMFGYGSSHIVLTGYGGVTINSRRAKPWQDMLISFAGPASSFALALGVNTLIHGVPRATADPMLRAMLPALVTVNVLWGILNLIPVSPLDGGHVVRNFFRMFLRERTAFVLSVWIGIVVGAVAVAVSVFLTIYFAAIFLAFYVWRNIQLWQEFRKSGMTGE
jgi:stage IV sporulation protein FB